ncbi:MAG: STELLO glycosyltransferase family protein [Candidatus Adlerbacteria bacterium]
MKKVIVTTTINPPTEAVLKLSQMPGWDNITIGDKKSPPGWHQDGVTYFSADDQATLPYALIQKLPWNLPARAMVGFLRAIEQGADIISQVDDDNIPLGAWEVPSFDGTYGHISEQGFVNIYKYFTDEFIWPRGYPLDKILEQKKPAEEMLGGSVGIWQHLADNDTDVDAIYRLTKGAAITFNKRGPLVLSAGASSPFNCQSTTYEKTAFPLLYLPAYISPRESDIVRGLIAQPILWCAGKTLGFTASTVMQERNPHNYLKDFAAEMLIYLHSEDIFNTAKRIATPERGVAENLRAVYVELIEQKFIPAQELELLDAWLFDIINIKPIA